MTVKLVGAWVVGSLFLLAGTWIIQNLKMELGVSEFSYVFAMIIALILFLLGGLAWISVAVATRHSFLE
jgi:hypothetical protein